MLKFMTVPTICSGISHGLAWVAFLWMAFWPAFYQGVSVTPVGPDGTGGERVHTTSSMVEVNGWWVLIPLLVPVILTAIGLLATFSPSPRKASRFVSMWAVAILLIVFCLLGMFSIGVFYLPAALLLLASTVIFTLRSHPKGVSSAP